jgi:hypothetical protein
MWNTFKAMCSNFRINERNKRFNFEKSMVDILDIVYRRDVNIAMGHFIVNNIKKRLL